MTNEETSLSGEIMMSRLDNEGVEERRVVATYFIALSISSYFLEFCYSDYHEPAKLIPGDASSVERNRVRSELGCAITRIR